MKLCNCGKLDNPIKACSEHRHDEWEIILILSGENVTSIGEIDYNVSEGNFLIIPPHTYHKHISKSGFSDVYIRLLDVGFTRAVCSYDTDGSIFTLMNLIHKITIEKRDDYVIISNLLADTVCRIVNRNLHICHKHNFVHQLKDEIYKNLSNCDFDLTGLILGMSYNPDYVRKCFRSELNVTPLKYLTDLRLNMAKGLLNSTYISVEEVARQCGYNDAYYFSRIFKKHFSVSPLAYRKRSLNIS